MFLGLAFRLPIIFGQGFRDTMFLVWGFRLSVWGLGFKVRLCLGLGSGLQWFWVWGLGLQCVAVFGLGLQCFWVWDLLL